MKAHLIALALFGIAAFAIGFLAGWTLGQRQLFDRIFPRSTRLPEPPAPKPPRERRP